MNGKFNYEKRHKYPHLLGEDIPVWNRFISKYPDRFDTVDYDILVGKGGDTSNIPDDNSKKQWVQLTRKRIDVIGYKNGFPTIIEVKKRVSLSTLGQVLGYRFLYLAEHPELPSVKIFIICSSIDQDDKDILNYYGVDFEVV